VSLAPLAARRAAEVADDLATVLAIEILAACRGLDLRRPLRPGAGVAATYEALRVRLPGLAEDRPLAPEIETVRALVLDGTLLAAAEGAVGRLEGIATPA
jgi:histidine ammonia-lyase